MSKGVFILAFGSLVPVNGMCMSFFSLLCLGASKGDGLIIFGVFRVEDKEDGWMGLL